MNRQDLATRVRTLPGVQRISALAVTAEAWWFDIRHNVRTRANKEDRLALAREATGESPYLPTRPGAARLMLQELPVNRYSDYTFVDFGSGKGRMLLLAAEHPFRRIEGIELREEHHDQALKNVRRSRGLKKKCAQIECIHMNAAEYEFPKENLVLYFFNPFGRKTMEKVLKRLNASLAQYPRDVLVMMLYPEFASIAEEMSRLRLCGESRVYRMYRAVDGQEN